MCSHFAAAVAAGVGLAPDCSGLGLGRQAVGRSMVLSGMIDRWAKIGHCC